MEENQTSVPVEPEQVTYSGEKKSKKLWIVLALTGIVLLGAAAFLAARLLNQRPTGPQMISVGSGAGGSNIYTAAQSVAIDMDPASEIPQTKPEIFGIVVELKDKSLMVAPGGNRVYTMGEDGALQVDQNQTGPSTEVVVTGDTKIYRDATFDDGFPEEGEKIQQIVEPVTFRIVEKNSMITVWGSKRGDRIIADVILLHMAGRVERAE